MRTETKQDASRNNQTNSSAAGQARAKQSSSTVTGGGILGDVKMSTINRNCSCGRPATLKMFGDAVCARCAAIDSKLDSYHDHYAKHGGVAQVNFAPTPSPFLFPAVCGNHYRKAVLC